jgi:hypothetical protein
MILRIIGFTNHRILCGCARNRNFANQATAEAACIQGHPYTPLSKVRYRTDDWISDKYHSVNCQLKYAKSRLQENHLLKDDWAIEK